MDSFVELQLLIRGADIGCSLWGYYDNTVVHRSEMGTGTGCSDISMASELELYQRHVQDYYCVNIYTYIYTYIPSSGETLLLMRKRAHYRGEVKGA